MTDIKQNKETTFQLLTITDLDTNPLFSGNPVYCLCNDITFSGDVLVSNNPMVLPARPDSAEDFSDEYNRLLAYNSYAGVNNPILSISGTWTQDIGSYTDTGNAILTPYKILKMAYSGRRFYVVDENISQQIYRETLNESGQLSPLFQFGIPVTIDSWSVKADAKAQGRVNWSINFKGDKI